MSLGTPQNRVHPTSKKTNMYQLIIGVDISKLTLDWCVTRGRQPVTEAKGDNTPSAIRERLRSTTKQYKCNPAEVLVCAEYTGHYYRPLAEACAALGVPLWLESGYLVSLYSKRGRGKSDHVDARRIAEYATLHIDNARLYVPPSEHIQRLRQLLSMRGDFVVQEGKYRAKKKDTRGYMNPDEYEKACAMWEEIRLAYAKQIKAVDAEVKRTIESDSTLQKQDELLRSIPGVGFCTSAMMIAATSAFTAFETGRQFCCYAGVAPFRYESGTSVHSKMKVSARANKDVKKQLHMAALSAAATSKSGLYHDYYERKCAEGKNKMAVLNNVRTKLVLVMFAVVRSGKPFNHNHIYKQ